MTLPTVISAAVAHASGAAPAPPTTTAGGIVTITGGPGATANIPGSHSDPADLYGILLVLAAILVAIALTRIIFRTRQDFGPRSTGPEEPPPSGPAQGEPGRS